MKAVASELGIGAAVGPPGVLIMRRCRAALPQALLGAVSATALLRLRTT